MTTHSVSSTEGLFQHVLECQQVSQLKKPDDDQQGEIEIIFQRESKSLTYTLSVNRKNELQVTWRKNILGFFNFTKVVTVETNSLRYKTAQKILALATVNSQLQPSIKNPTTAALIDTTRSPSVGKRLSGIQLCSLLRKDSNDQLLTHMEQLKQRKNYSSQIIPAMAKYLTDKQITFLIKQMIEREENREDIKLLLKCLPIERQGNFRVIPFEKCQYFASYYLNEAEFKSLCLALDYQQAMALLRSIRFNESSFTDRKQTLSDIKYQELRKDAEQMKTDASFDPDKPCDIDSFPSKNSETENETNAGSKAQNAMNDVVKLAQSNPDSIKEQLTLFPCCEIAQMLNLFATSNTIATVTDRLTNAKLSLSLKSCSVVRLAKLINLIPNNPANIELLNRCAELDDRVNYLAHMTTRTRDNLEQLNEQLEQETNKAFNQRLLG
ncbi:hypothetical protein JQC92_04025 [Shewanella sp. 202IG2-18]|uniref:hypothetical protein n=1 Tax=Parashewanella hymeniacidonis TaxID=2807618 RepID=UPI001961F1F0|nr:hypothetical protein [Parashewanella hymeniacidonis]MBM7071210.1 hypothetical protein [Parashewanella hymeniacidonis]